MKLIHAITWMNLKHIMLSERRQTAKKNILNDSIHVRRKYRDGKVERWLPGIGGREELGLAAFIWGEEEIFWMLLMVVHHSEYTKNHMCIFLNDEF